jgi:hypothetical protein
MGYSTTLLLQHIDPTSQFQEIERKMWSSVENSVIRTTARPPMA